MQDNCCCRILSSLSQSVAVFIEYLAVYWWDLYIIRYIYKWDQVFKKLQVGLLMYSCVLQQYLKNTNALNISLIITRENVMRIGRFCIYTMGNGTNDILVQI